MMQKFGRRHRSSPLAIMLICSLRSRSTWRPSVFMAPFQTQSSRLSLMLHQHRPRQFTPTISGSFMRSKKSKKQSWLLLRSRSWQSQRLKQSLKVPHKLKRLKKKQLLHAPLRSSLLRSLKRLNQKRRTKQWPLHAASISLIRTSLPRSSTSRSSTWDTSRPGRPFSIHGSICPPQRSETPYVTIFGPTTLEVMHLMLSCPKNLLILLSEGS